MKEEQAIQQVTAPHTVASLSSDFLRVGIHSGMTLLVHSSLSSLGWVCGGAIAVIQALMTVLTDEGTLVMPTHTGDLSNPARWQNPPVPESWWETIRSTMPAFHPDYTPTRGMGAIPEVFRNMPGVVRSHHPTVSFAAYGKHAAFVTSNHSLTYSLGNLSPLARVYDLDGSILLLGVGYGNNTSFHLSEARARGSKIYQESSPVTDQNGKRSWTSYEEIDWDDEPFDRIGKDFEAAFDVKPMKIGVAESRLFRQNLAVDYAVKWLEKARGY